MDLKSSAISTQQQSVLIDLVRKAQATRFGVDHDFSDIKTYDQFTERVPPQTYNDIQPYIRELKKGTENIFWPGRVQQFAVSAGTSGQGKHLPFTQERRQSDKRFMRKVVTSYLKQRPNIFSVMGSHLSMPGSVEKKKSLQIGEISGFTALNAPAWIHLFQLVDPQKLTELNFQQKFDLLLEKAIHSNLKVITAVPSWILTLFQKTLKKTGKSSIADVWPNLQLLVCGGVKLANYRPHLQQLAKGLDLDFIETYGASEGYIGFTDNFEKTDLKMVTENGIFYECVPHPLPNTDTSNIQETKPLWEVETGVPYGLLLTTNAGLWRYTLNDIIEFTSLNPPRFVVKGRVNDMLDDFGEALYIYEAEKVLKKLTAHNQYKIGNFAIAPVLESKNSTPYHRWFIQFRKSVHPDTLQKLSEQIDEGVRAINRHYAIRRESGALGTPDVSSITQDDINTWMEKNDKAHAQGKLPKILPKNTTSLLDIR